MKKGLDDQKCLIKIRETGEHLSSNAVNKLPRLGNILEKEELLIIFYIDTELNHSDISSFKLDELSDIVMGKNDKPTAVRLLFEILNDNQYEPSRLEAGKILFKRAKVKITNNMNSGIHALKEKFKAGLVSNNDSIRTTSLWCLFKLWGSEAFDICSYALSDHKFIVRFEISRLFGFLKDNRAVPVLIRSFKKERQAKVRSVILWALGYIKDPKALKSLITHLNDEDKEAGCYAAWALGEIGGPQAEEALMDTLANTKTHIEVRLWAFRALHRIKEHSRVAGSVS